VLCGGRLPARSIPGPRCPAKISISLKFRNLFLNWNRLSSVIQRTKRSSKERKRENKKIKYVKIDLAFIFRTYQQALSKCCIYTGLDRPTGFQEVEAPRFPDKRHMKVVSLSALRTGRVHSQEIFLVF
jgi:hypothetical protein